MTNGSDKSRFWTLFWSWPLGLFGAHRFYVGKTRSGIAQLLTLGGLGFWALVDSFLILFGVFTDEHGRKIIKWFA